MAEEVSLREAELSFDERKVISGYQFLSLKPVCVVANIREEQINNPPTAKLERAVEMKNLTLVNVCVKLENEIAQLKKDEQEVFLKDAGITQPGRDRVISACLRSLGLISFFIVVGNEVKAWSVSDQTKAVVAARSVHSDMERGFIRAEIIGYEDFFELGSFAKAKENGILRLESKDYIVQDGDIINFKFSV